MFRCGIISWMIYIPVSFSWGPFRIVRSWNPGEDVDYHEDTSRRDITIYSYNVWSIRAWCVENSTDSWGVPYESIWVYFGCTSESGENIGWKGPPALLGRCQCFSLCISSSQMTLIQYLSVFSWEPSPYCVTKAAPCWDLPLIVFRLQQRVILSRLALGIFSTEVYTTLGAAEVKIGGEIR